MGSCSSKIIEEKEEFPLISIIEAEDYLLLINNFVWIDENNIGLIGIHKKSKKTEIIICNIFENQKIYTIYIETGIYKFLSFDIKQNQFGAIINNRIFVWDKNGIKMLDDILKKEILYFGWMDIWEEWFFVTTTNNDENSIEITSITSNGIIGKFKITLLKDKPWDKDHMGSIITDKSEFIIISYYDHILMNGEIDRNPTLCYSNIDGSKIHKEPGKCFGKISYLHTNDTLVHLYEMKKHESTLFVHDTINGKNIKWKMEKVENMLLNENGLIAFYLYKPKSSGLQIKIYDISMKHSKSKIINILI